MNRVSPRVHAWLVGIVVALGAAGQVARSAQGPPASTPAVEQLRRWLDVFNAADPERWRQFLSQFATPRPGPYVPQNLALRRQVGGFELVRIDDASATRAVAIVKERESESIGARLIVEVEAADPHRIVDVQIEPGVRLPVQIARLPDAALSPAIESELVRRSADGRFAGAVLVAKGGVPVHQSAWGLADREQNVPNRLDTRFRNGSMNKMFTAVAVMTLVQAGKVRLEEPIGTYLPAYPNGSVSRRVTVHHLLTHTGGTGDAFGPEFAANRDRIRQHQDYVDRFAAQPLLFDPGTRWAYSNYGFILLGALIEKVSGRSYYEYVRDHVYVPSGMRDTGSEPEGTAVPRLSVGYMRPPGSPASMANTPTLPYRGTAAGGGYTTVGDLMRFADALMSHTLLSAEATRLLTTGKVEGAGGRYAYGFIEHVSNGVRSVGHGGNAPGMDGSLEIFPESGYVVAVLANTDPPAAQRVSEFVVNRVPAR